LIKRVIMRSYVVRVLGIFWILTLSILPVWASETESSSSEDWSFTVQPYVWAISLKGSAAPLPPLPATDFEASFGDIWKDLNLGFFGNAELRKGKFGIIGDVIWADLSMDSGGPLGGLIEIDSSSVIASLLGAYRLLEKEQAWLDLVVGARGYYIDTSLDVGPGGIFFTSEHTEGWVDAMAGIRARIELGMGFHAQAFLIGGGGGSSSAADLMGRIGYSFTDNLSTYAGYRFLKIDYKNNGFVWDVEYQGPLVGGSYKF
jgi:hypothetical protein